MPASAKSTLVSGVHQLRRLVPARLAPALARRRTQKLMTIPEYREQQEAQMRFLLEHTDRAGEIPVLAHRLAEEATLKSYLRWHPRVVTREPVRGVEWLTTKRDPNRAVVLSFIHHYRYEGMFKALQRHGVDIDILITPLWGDKTMPAPFRHHLKVMGSGGRMVRAVGGTDAIAAMLKPGVVMAIASDVPGTTEVTWLGRRVRGSFGAARIAAMTNSPVVVVRSLRDENGSYLEVDPPLEPSDFAGPRELLDAIIARHGEAVLAWPEVLDTPLSRFGALEE